jgi:hypothetical protein
MTVDPTQINDREELAEFLTGRDDGEINQIALDVGVAGILSRVFEQMAQDFDPGNGPRDDVVVRWDIRGPDGLVHTWRMVARPDGCSVEEGQPHEPRVTLKVSLVVFLKLVTGLISGMRALSTGKLKLKGDLMLATSIDKWFLR